LSRPTYPLLVRFSHALNVVVFVLMAMSGMQIFNAHPRLYASDDADPAHLVFSLPGPTASGDNAMVVAGQTVGTGSFAMPYLPAAVTIGGWLGGSRRVHFTASWFFVVNGVLYLAYMLARPRKRAVWPGLQDLRDLPRSVREHLRWPPVLHGPNGALNPMQKIGYFAVPVLLAPMIVATGLALSPTWDAIVPWWTDLFGGRQFARTWHFVSMVLFFSFIIAHVSLVLLSGPTTWAKMVTGGAAPKDVKHEA
jgi:thiosulfate reductase cytochrome b subunit